MKWRIVLAAGASALLWTTHARAEAPHTLKQALAAAYSNNPMLQSERAHLRAVDENVPTALSGWRPSVVVQASPGTGYGYSLFGVGTSGVNPFTGQRTNGESRIKQGRLEYSVQGSITQPIYTGGKTVAQTHQAENTVMAERARLIATEQQVFTDTVNAYVTVIENERLLELQKNNEEVLSRQLQATNDRFHVGEITRTDVAQAESALATARAQRQTAEGNLQTARATYFREVGAMPEHLADPQPLKLPVKDETAANKLAAANNPNVIQALFQDSAARDAIDVAYATLLPQMNLQATGFRNFNEIEPHTDQVGGAVTLNATVPIYQGGAEYSAIRSARQSEQQARKSLDDTRRQAVQQATQAYETLIAARAAIASDRAAVRAGELALEGVEREALVGSRTTFDVLQQQTLLLQTRVTLVQNLAALVTASYTVASAVGRLTARDLGLPVPLYDDTAYYKAVRDRWFGAGDYATGQPGR